MNLKNRLFGQHHRRPRSRPRSPSRNTSRDWRDRIVEDVLREIEADWDRQVFEADVSRAIMHGRAKHRLNWPQSDSTKRIYRYHPYFQSRGRRLLNRDREPFPGEIDQVGRVFSENRRVWLKNYYEDNPGAFRRAINKPKNLQNYLKKHFKYGFEIRPMKNWINSRSHTVKSGDNLTRIARQHNVPLRKLKARNQWLLKRLGGKKQSGFNFLRPGDKIVLPPRWQVPRGRTEPFPHEVIKFQMRDRQSWLRDYYEVNPLAAQRARRQARTIIDWAHKHLRDNRSKPFHSQFQRPSISPSRDMWQQGYRSRPFQSQSNLQRISAPLSRSFQTNPLRQIGRALINPNRARPAFR